MYDLLGPLEVNVNVHLKIKEHRLLSDCLFSFFKFFYIWSSYFYFSPLIGPELSGLKLWKHSEILLPPLVTRPYWLIEVYIHRSLGEGIKSI